MRMSQRRFCRKYIESYEYLHFENQSHYVNYWTPEQMHVLDVRSGITAPASIKFRNENELMEKAADHEDYYIHVIMQEKIKLYLEYVKNASFWYDFKLIFKTFEVIVKE